MHGQEDANESGGDIAGRIEENDEMNNYIQPGKVITLTAPAGGVTSGNGYQIGQIFVVAANDADATDPFEGKTDGVFTLPKDNTQAWTEGDLLYWDDDNDEVSTTAGANLLIGCAAADADSSDTEGSVRLNGVAQGESAAALLSSGQDTTIYDHADDAGANEAVAAASVDRVVMVVARVTETLAGTTTEPTFHVGYTSDPDAFLAIEAGDADDVRFGTGVLPAGDTLDVTVTDGSGGSEAGQVEISVVAIPTA